VTYDDTIYKYQIKAHNITGASSIFSHSGNSNQSISSELLLLNAEDQLWSFPVVQPHLGHFFMSNNEKRYESTSSHWQITLFELRDGQARMFSHIPPN
jgi:hypothetical protein